MNELALFAGAGGGILAGKMVGWRTVCAVEWEPYPASVLAARQNDGLLPPFPIWDDVRNFDGRPWRGVVDVVSGGFPCQDISVAGKGDGLDGERSGLWSEMARIIGEVRPRFAFVENSPALTSRGLGRVLGDLAALGMHAQWGVVSAADTLAPHGRERIWILADSHRVRESQQERSERYQRGWTGDGSKEARSYADSLHAQGKFAWIDREEEWPESGVRPSGSLRPDGGWWASEPDVGRMAHGVAARSHRLKALGNGQVPQCAAYAWRILSGGI